MTERGNPMTLFRCLPLALVAFAFHAQAQSLSPAYDAFRKKETPAPAPAPVAAPAPAPSTGAFDHNAYGDLTAYADDDMDYVAGKKGVDVVFEHVGADTWQGSLLSMKRGGRLVTCGATSGPSGSINLMQLFQQRFACR